MCAIPFDEATIHTYTFLHSFSVVDRETKSFSNEELFKNEEAFRNILSVLYMLIRVVLSDSVGAHAHERAQRS